MCLIYWKEEQHTHTEKVSERDRETWRERLPCTDSLPPDDRTRCSCSRRKTGAWKSGKASHVTGKGLNTWAIFCFLKHSIRELEQKQSEQKQSKQNLN